MQPIIKVHNGGLGQILAVILFLVSEYPCAKEPKLISKVALEKLPL